ncbi:MAG TPA: outer membrane beta-barrel protein [Terracidiphilus sp.]|jgi:hypothetical protein
MYLKENPILKLVAGIAVGISVPVFAQAPVTPAAAQATPPAAALAATPAAPAATDAAAPATPKPWHFAGFDFSGFGDGFYTWNDNHPTNFANGEMNDFYNFNQDANQPALSALKLTMDHAPAPVGAHFDFVYGRTNKLINAPNQLYYVEQAFVSVKPPKAKGFELDLGKFVTSAGAETIEAKDNWNYSRSLLFAWAIPYWHFGARTSMPVSKVETLGVQIVNGWNNIGHSTGGVTAGFTSGLVEPKYTVNVNVYTGPASTDTQHAYRNLLDTTLLLTPNSKFNAYVNFDFGTNKDSINSAKQGDDAKSFWNGIALAAHEQLTATQAVAARVEYFDDEDGFSTGTRQVLKEFTGTYEYHLKYGLVSRLEYRHDSSDEPTFHRGNAMTDGQSTLGVGLIMILAPKR